VVAGLAVLAAALGPAALGAPSALAASPSSGAKVTFTVGIPNDIDSLNPFTGVEAEAYEAWALMYDPLIGYSDKDFSPVPGLAESWKSSADQKTWTYTIRSGVTWSDGKPVTARDIAYTYRRILDGDYEQTNWGSYLRGITKVTATDDTTLVLTASTPTPNMTKLYVPILPQHTWSAIDGKKVRSFANEKDVVTSGPFRLVERKTGQFVRFAANKQYWGGAPKIDEVVFKVYTNQDALAQALKKGEVDFAENMEADPWESLKGTPGITTRASRYPGFDQVTFNTGAALVDGTPIGDGNPALKDKRFRVALNYAIDRDLIQKRGLNGTGSAGSTLIPPLFATYHLQPPTPYSFDLAKANSLLDQAGYTKGPDGVRRLPSGGKAIKLRFFARSESPISQQTAQFVKGWFKDVGLPVTITVMSEDTLTERLGQGTFDMSEWGWVVDPGGDAMLSYMTCDQRSSKDAGTIYAGYSDSFYCNKEYDQLYALQSTQVDPAQRAQTVKQMQQILYDDAPYAITFYYDDLQGYSDRFTGYIAQPPPDGAVLFAYGTFSYRSIELATQKKSEAAGGGSRVPVVVAVGAGAAVLVAAGGFLLARRRRHGSGGSSGLGRHAARRGLTALGTLAFVMVFNFLLFRALPGDPIRLYTRGRNVSAEQVARLRAELNRPIAEQFLTYIRNPFSSEINSAKFNQPVWSVIGDRVWPTVLLLGVSTLLATAIGIRIGIRAGWSRGSRFDRWSTGGTLILYAMPEFWLGMLLLIGFGTGVGPLPGVLPLGGLNSAGVDPSSLAGGWDVVKHLILPVATLTLGYLAEYSLVMRSSLLDEIGEDYLTTARAKGLMDADIRRRHAVPNALLPTTTLVFLNLGFFVGGAITVETVFSWPGLGLLSYQALSGPDVALLQALFLLFSIAVVFFNLIADVLYAVLDPRVRV
jgi:peptide/nickel transport system substrate-binding protein